MRGIPVLAAIATLAGITPAARAFPKDPPCTAFVDVTVVATDRLALQSHQTVTTREDRILRITPATTPPPAACQQIEGRNRFLIPGLVDSHIHFFGYTRAGAGDLQVERNILLMLLANGITTAAVMQGAPAILSLRTEVAAGRILGPTLFIAGNLIQMPGSGESPGQQTFTTPDEVRQEVIAEKKAGYDFIKVHGDLPAETYAALLATARQHKIPVIGHVPNNLGIDATLAGGQRMITHAESYLDGYFRFHRDMPTDPAEIDTMVRDIAAKTARSGVYVQPTLSVFRQIIAEVADIDAELGRPEMRYLPAAAKPDWLPPHNPYLDRWKLTDLPRFRAQYSLMQRLVRGLRDAGVPLLVGTDPMVPVQLPGFSLRDEMRQLAEAGLTPFEVLQAATFNQARFLGNLSDSGSIEQGKAADLVLLDANPLDDVDNLSRQDGVMLRGRWFPESELQRILANAVPADPPKPTPRSTSQTPAR